MALVVKDRVKETTTTTGTGTLTLAGAVSGFQTFTSVLSNGDTTYYAIFESSTNAFEVGLGTFTASGTTLARTTVLESSNSGSAVDLAAGSKDVFITYPAEKSAYLDASDNLVINGTAITATAAELNYVDGVTSAIQTQLDAKAPIAGPTFTGDVTLPDKIVHTGDTNTAIRFADADTVTVETGGSERIRVTDTGLGVGTTSTYASFSVNGDGGAASTGTQAIYAQGAKSSFASASYYLWQNQLAINDTTSPTTGTGGALSLLGRFDTGDNNPTTAATVEAAKTNSTDTNYSFDAVHRIRHNGNATMQEHMRLSPTFNSWSISGTEKIRVDSTGADVSGELIADSYNEKYAALSGTTPTVDCHNGNNFAITTSGNTTFTFSNPPTSGTAFGFTLKITAGGTHSLTWPGTVDYAGGSAPDAPASGETDIYVFYTVDGGTNWYGFLAGDAMS